MWRHSWFQQQDYYFSEKPPSDDRLEDTELLRLDLTEESPLKLLWVLGGPPPPPAPAWGG